MWPKKETQNKLWTVKNLFFAKNVKKCRVILHFSMKGCFYEKKMFVNETLCLLKKHFEFSTLMFAAYNGSSTFFCKFSTNVLAGSKTSGGKLWKNILKWNCYVYVPFRCNRALFLFSQNNSKRFGQIWNKADWDSNCFVKNMNC